MDGRGEHLGKPARTGTMRATLQSVTREISPVRVIDETLSIGKAAAGTFSDFEPLTPPR
jgi:hypothetical protein